MIDNEDGDIRFFMYHQKSVPTNLGGLNEKQLLRVFTLTASTEDENERYRYSPCPHIHQRSLEMFSKQMKC